MKILHVKKKDYKPSEKHVFENDTISMNNEMIYFERFTWFKQIA